MRIASSPPSREAVVHLRARSLGSALDLHRARTGVVHSVFAGALNLAMDGELWTVLDAPRPDLPFGIRLEGGAPAGWGGAVAGALARVSGDGSLSVGRLSIDCRHASRWLPSPWGRPAAGIAARLDAVEALAAPRAWSGTVAMARTVTGALTRPDDQPLAECVRAVVGRGPGLTPSGDDLLVGMLAMLLSPAAGLVGDQHGTRLVAAIAPALASTTDISRHLLVQASHRLFGRTLHELGAVLMAADATKRVPGALLAALATGATSGADACLGLVAAGRLTFLASERTAA